MQVPEGEWEIICSREQFEKFKEKDGFGALLTLGRIANALRFLQLAYPRDGDDTPSARRQRLNSFMFMAAVLYEAIKYANTVGRRFAGTEAFDATLGELLADDDVKALRRGILRHLRNKITFHFEDQIIGKALDVLDFPNRRFVTGVGKRAGDTYFDLADEVAAHSILIADDEKELMPFEELAGLMQQTAEISRRFLDSTDSFITEELISMGWEARERRKGV